MPEHDPKSFNYKTESISVTNQDADCQLQPSNRPNDNNVLSFFNMRISTNAYAYDINADEMLVTVLFALGIPICVTSNALIARVSARGNLFRQLEDFLDAEKIITICDQEMQTRSPAIQAAWHSIRDDVSVTDAAQRFSLSRETVSRAKSKFMTELQHRFGYTC